MANRENSSDSASQTGKSYPAGSAAASANNTIRNISISKDITATTLSKVGKSGPFNGHAVEVFADGAVWDTVSSKYLLPGTDFNFGDLQRS